MWSSDCYRLSDLRERLNDGIFDIFNIVLKRGCKSDVVSRHNNIHLIHWVKMNEYLVKTNLLLSKCQKFGCDERQMR